MLHAVLVGLRRMLGAVARFWGLRPPLRPPAGGRLRVLIAGGYGYSNVGDEAQLAANLQHWRQAAPGCELTVLTPDPAYTEGLHGCRVERAPRVVFFRADRSLHYAESTRVFKLHFLLLAPLLLLNARLVRAGLPVCGITAAQARLLEVIQQSEVLFFSGGGYLTGKTLSRLWDSMLLIRLASLLGVPTILSGQTIGVFGDRGSRALARWGLRRAQLIYLRDRSESRRDVMELGSVPASRVECTFDDALFLEAAPAQQVRQVLEESGIDPEAPYLAVNIHYWGQAPQVVETVTGELATLLEVIRREWGLQIALVAMHPGDEWTCQQVRARMSQPPPLVRHGYQPAVVVGVIRGAAACLSMKHHPIIFAMGGAVPTIAVALDEYYDHKNQGALELFGQAQCSLRCEPGELRARVLEKLPEVLEKREQISAEIRRNVEQLRPRAGEVIYRWLAAFWAYRTGS